MRRLSSAQIAITVLCAAMAVLFLYEVWAPPAAYSLPEIHLKPPALAVTAPPPFVPPPPTSFDAINERPPFLPSRKALAAPATAGTAATAGPPPLPSATLVGVLLSGADSMAEVKRNGATFVQAVHIGEMLEGWQVAAIGPDSITLRAGPYSQELRMDAKAAPAGGPQPPGNPPPGTPPGTPQ